MFASVSQKDNLIELSARQSYVFRIYLKYDDIKINSRDGRVTLTGMVTEDFHKSLAEETLESLPGVKSVNNRLKVKEPLQTKYSDLWIRSKIQITLLFHSSVSSVETKVDVKDGIVTLQGSAINQAQKELTAEYVRDIEGVKKIINELAVSKTAKDLPQTNAEKIDDASITAQIKMVLMIHRSTSAINTTVATDRGVVTLRGEARNETEKVLVNKLVSDIKGVISINNKMSIK
jgi:osmotically-inducible protein OsmY